MNHCRWCGRTFNDQRSAEDHESGCSERPEARTKPRVKLQGRAIVERHDCLIIAMLPNGDIESAIDERGILTKIRKWFHRHADHGVFNVASVEWRDGLKPPTEGE